MFKCFKVLTDELLKEFSVLDLEHKFEESYTVDTLSSDEEFFLSCDYCFMEKKISHINSYILHCNQVLPIPSQNNLLHYPFMCRFYS